MIWLMTLIMLSQAAPEAAGLEFLRLGVGSRAVALGNTGVASPEDPYGLFYNPALPAFSGHGAWTTGYGRWLLQTNLVSLAGLVPLSPVSAFNVGLRGLFTGDIEGRSEDDPWDVYYYSAYFVNPAIGYAHRLGNFGLGVNLSALAVKIDEESGMSALGSIGVAYARGAFALGLALQNVGWAVMETSPPVAARLGLRIAPRSLPVKVSTDVLYPFNDEPAWYAGFEITPASPIALRLGYNSDFSAEGFFEKLSAGVGVQAGNLCIDYALAMGGKFQATHYVTLAYHPISRVTTSPDAMAAKEQLMSETYVNQGVEYYNQQKLDEALNAWDLALIWLPDNADALQWIERVQVERKAAHIREFVANGRAAFNGGDYLTAMYVFQQALELDSSITEVRSLKQEAERQLKAAASAEVQEKIEAGMVYYRAGQYLKAVQVWSEIIASDPNNATARDYIDQANQAMVGEISAVLQQLADLVNLGSLKKAQDLARKMLVKYPNQENLTQQKTVIDQKLQDRVNALLTQAKTAYNAQDHGTAEKEFRKVLDLDPKNTQALSYLDKIQQATTKGRKEDAARFYLLGIDAYTKNNFELAIDYWNRVLAIDANYPNARKNLERAHLKLAELNK